MLWVWGESRGSPKAKEIKEWKQATRTKTEKEKKKTDRANERAQSLGHRAKIPVVFLL